MTIGISQAVFAYREQFFRTVFGDQEGYLAIGVKNKVEGFYEAFFEYPNQLREAGMYIIKKFQKSDIYFCVNLLADKTKGRTKGNVDKCRTAWADLDPCEPTIINPIPSISIETSPRRYQGIWLLDHELFADEAEDISHRIAYHYKSAGVDSGWALNKYLRVPKTYNHKYDGKGDQVIVEIVGTDRPQTLYSIDDFKHLAPVPGYEYMVAPLPERNGVVADEILERFRRILPPDVYNLYYNAPERDWSEKLWRLECVLLERGATKEETFFIAEASACNKYARDNRGETALWQEVGKAAVIIHERQATVYSTESIVIPALLRENEKPANNYFTDRFVKWGVQRSDAPEPFFVAGAFTILSALLCANIALEVEYGDVITNLWFMLTGASTVDRKTTAMSMAMRMLREVDEDVVLATDGSIEGILKGVQARPGRAGVFFRDEFSGLLAAAAHKDYMAGLLENLTQLYDGEYQKRILSKDIIELRDPRLVILCGGVASRILEAMTLEHITSGFVPRFLFVSAPLETRPRKPLGPRSNEDDTTRASLVKWLNELKDRYTATKTLKVAGTTGVSTSKKIWKVQLTPEAWTRYNEYENTLVDAALKSISLEVYPPIMDRLAKSTLKAACLLAASRQDPAEHDIVMVEKADLIKAISYAQEWVKDAILIAEGVGETVSERRLQSMYGIVHARAELGAGRSFLMQKMKLNSKETDIMLETLEQRNLIVRVNDHNRKAAEVIYDYSAQKS